MTTQITEWLNLGFLTEDNEAINLDIECRAEYEMDQFGGFLRITAFLIEQDFFGETKRMIRTERGPLFDFLSHAALTQRFEAFDGRTPDEDGMKHEPINDARHDYLRGIGAFEGRT